jgi:arylsulfatase A-like enzyme
MECRFKQEMEEVNGCQRNRNYAGRWTPPDLQALGGSTYQHLGGYFGMVKRLDEAFGRLHDALRSLNLSDDTIVLFTSDHGNISRLATRNISGLPMRARFVSLRYSQVGRAIRTKRWKYGVTAPDGDGWNQAGSERYVEDILYDLEADPHELVNLAGHVEYREVADSLRERLLSRMQQAGEPKAVIEPAPPTKAWGQRKVYQ